MYEDKVLTWTLGRENADSLYEACDLSSLGTGPFTNFVISICGCLEFELPVHSDLRG